MAHFEFVVREGDGLAAQNGEFDGAGVLGFEADGGGQRGDSVGVEDDLDSVRNHLVDGDALFGLVFAAPGEDAQARKGK